jgi:predicted nucleic acid-binding protein
MRLVTDASAILSLAFRGEAVAYGQRVLDEIREGGAGVPSIFWYEVRNVLITGERRNRILPNQSASFLALLDQVPSSFFLRPGSRRATSS